MSSHLSNPGLGRVGLTSVAPHLARGLAGGCGGGWRAEEKVFSLLSSIFI